MRVTYAERARSDIVAIYEAIAAHDRAAAQRVEDLIRSRCQGLAVFPFASVPTDEPGIRRLPLVRHPFTIYFRVDLTLELVEVARVIHAARFRDLGRLPAE